MKRKVVEDIQRIIEPVARPIALKVIEDMEKEKELRRKIKKMGRFERSFVCLLSGLVDGTYQVRDGKIFGSSGLLLCDTNIAKR